MLHPPLKSPGKTLRDLWQNQIVVMPGAFSALTALAAYKQGAQAVYLSGGAMTNNITGLPDIAVVTPEEFATTAARSCQVAPVPILCDADTGFGDVWNVARTVIEMERAGLAGIHLEDQVSPKRCGHLDGKEVISTAHMETKIRAAAAHKSDPSFLILARTDARNVEGVDSAIDRAKAYVQAGADGIFPEGLHTEAEFEQFRAGLPGAPLLANMTEFGKTPLIPAAKFNDLGYQMVIFPVTALRVMLKAVGGFYAELLETGTQAGWMDKMVTRQELYETIDYPDFTAKDHSFSQPR